MSRLSFCYRFLAILAILAALYTSGAPVSAAQTDLPTAPQVGPPFFLNDPTNTDAPYEPNPPVIDGIISPGEYANAARLVFSGYGGDIEVFIAQTVSDLVIGFNSADKTPASGINPSFEVFLDTLYDRAPVPQPDDYRLTLSKSNTTFENQGNGSDWAPPAPALQWTGAARSVPWGWQGEFAISFSKAGLPPTLPQTVIGLGLAEVWTPSWPVDWYWPAGGYWFTPSTWGSLGSSSHWTLTYWKPGPWADYAPSGMPDFDQRQAKWGVPIPGDGTRWTHAGPLAAANSLWWFDSKFESSLASPLIVTDTYRLVTSYLAGLDDHDPNNVIPFVDDLANNYFGTNNGILGTNIISMTLGMDAYLRARGLWDDYSVTLVEKPSFDWVADEVMRSEDVILLLGFWEQNQAGAWQRVGGHYVTVAGVTGQRMIAFSDPYQDYAESPIGVGRVLSGTLIAHAPIPGHPSFVHNDAGNISHDFYPVADTNSPGGIWGPVNYPWAEMMELFGVNPHPEFETMPYLGFPIQVEVEYALAVSPLRWKSSGYWSAAAGGWVPWLDYAPSGLPDFDQRQDNWKFLPSGRWSFCGPVAAANSLWWFDSKFEPNPVPPLAYNDNYNLVSSFATMLPKWDDHDPLNVDSAATVWPPGGELVETLAQFFQTDVIGSGTVVTDVFTGLKTYISVQMPVSRYTITQTKAPDFWFIGEHVRRSSDVLLLLGFWEQLQTGGYQRLGGHYVTVAGVDLPGGYVAFSDPWFNRIEATWPLAGMGATPGWPWYTGRVSNGWLTPHIHPKVPPDIIHNDAGNISHDIYHVVPTSSPGGIWGPEFYVTSWSQIENFWGQNGGGSPYLGGPIFTEVEWAVIVSHAYPIYLPSIRH